MTMLQPKNWPKWDATAERSVQLATELLQLRFNLLDQLWRGASYLVLMCMPLWLLLLHEQGWHVPLAFSLPCAMLLLPLAFYRRHLSYAVLSKLLTGLLWLIGLPWVMHYGLSSHGLWWMLMACVYAGALWGRRQILVSLPTLVLWFVLSLNVTSHPADSPLLAGLSLLCGGAFLSLLMHTSSQGYGALMRMLLNLKSQADILEIDSKQDPLTGLPTLRLMADRLLVAQRAAQRNNHKVGILFVDLDGFKAINDNYGHEAGDHLLKKVAQRLRCAAREEDTVARIGGDEFLVLLPRLEQGASAAEVARRIVHSLSQPFAYQGVDLHIGASIGIAIYPDHASDSEGLRRAADQAMYRVKHSTKSGYAFAHEFQEARSKKRLD
ncbi:diguanylate cyclase domain-containing protein [Roseateles sp.]|uniref:diguanylate cyclase domain-containing protein n=1 Tax=Roseateles sp. TaxID=1971397 RepID=UPI003BA73827